MDIDYQGVASVVAAVGAATATVIAALAAYNASKARQSSADNKAKLDVIGEQTNSLTHALTKVAQTDADARLVVAQQPTTPPVVVNMSTPNHETKVE